MKTLNQEVDVLRRIPLFSAIDSAKLKLLAFASHRMSFNEGQYLFRQGEVGDAAYVIIDGEADILINTDDGELSVAKMGTNDFIGEIAILCDVPRTASVRALSELTTLKIKKEHFLGLMSDFPELAVQVMREIAGRLGRTTTELSDTREKLDAALSGK